MAEHLAAATTLAVTTSAGAGPGKALLIVIVTFGLIFVFFAALAAGFNTTIQSVAAPLKGRALPTVGVLIANFVVVPLLVGLTLHAFHFAAQATMAFAVLSVVAGAPFVATFTKLAYGDVAYAGTMSLVLMLVTIPVMPLVLPWMLTELHVVHPSVTAWHLLKPMLWFIVLPLAIGVAVRWRHPAVARGWSPHCMQLALVGIAVHVILMFVAFWNQVVAEVGTGEYLYSIFMPIGCLIVGYGACLLVTLGTAPGARVSTQLPAALGTAQRGSQALICSLIFAMGKYPVAGVVALGSSVITIVILVLMSAEIGRRAEAGKQRDRERAAEPVSVT